jgi:hypothetical protein
VAHDRQKYGHFLHQSGGVSWTLTLEPVLATSPS